jgi:hypothetical protein
MGVRAIDRPRKVRYCVAAGGGAEERYPLVEGRREGESNTTIDDMRP